MFASICWYVQRAHKNAVATAVAGGADPLTLDTRLGYPSWLIDESKWSDTDLDYVGSTDSGSAEFEVFTSEVRSLLLWLLYSFVCSLSIPFFVCSSILLFALLYSCWLLQVVKGTVCLGGNNDWIGSSALPSVRAPLAALCNYVVLVGPPDVDDIYPTLPPTMPSANAAAAAGVSPAAGGLAQGVVIGIVVALLCTVPGCLIVGGILIALLVVYRKPIAKKLRDVRSGQTYDRRASEMDLVAGAYVAPDLAAIGQGLGDGSAIEAREWQGDGIGDQLSSAFTSMEDGGDGGDVL